MPAASRPSPAYIELESISGACTGLIANSRAPSESTIVNSPRPYVALSIHRARISSPWLATSGGLRPRRPVSGGQRVEHQQTVGRRVRLHRIADRATAIERQ